VGIYAEMMKSNEFTHVYITEGYEHLPLPWYIAFCAMEEPVFPLAEGRRYLRIHPPIFLVDWPQVWPSTAYFALIELRNTLYTIKDDYRFRYRDISCLEVFSFPKL
jgi:hypothetical protein